MKQVSIITALSLVSLPAFAGGSAPVIEQPATPPAVSPWEFRMALYGWAEGIDGDIGFLGRTAPVDIGFSEIVQELNFGFMGAFEIKHNRWSVVADLVYADIGADETIANGLVTVDYNQKQFLGNFTINYEAVKTADYVLTLYAGARVNYIDIDLGITGPFGFNPSGNESKGWVDPIIGARFAANLSEKFFFYASGDIGGFDVSSQLTWQAMAGFGYRVTENGSFILGYRAIGTDYTDGGFTYDVVASGPVIGFEYKF